MSIFKKLEDLEKKVNIILNNTPEWIPLSSKLAEQKGFKTLDGLRKHCIKNVHPSQFKQFGKSWHLHRDAWFAMV